MHSQNSGRPFASFGIAVLWSYSICTFRSLIHEADQPLLQLLQEVEALPGHVVCAHLLHILAFLRALWNNVAPTLCHRY